MDGQLFCDDICRVKIRQYLRVTHQALRYELAAVYVQIDKPYSTRYSISRLAPDDLAKTHRSCYRTAQLAKCWTSQVDRR